MPLAPVAGDMRPPPDRDRDRRHVAWDVETTGLTWEDELTVAGLWLPDGRARLVCNAPDADPAAVDAVAERLTDVGGVPVTVEASDGERATLRAFARTVFEYVERDRDRLVAYNADAWQGGFDLPFLRTRCARLGVGWPLDGYSFLDLWQPVKKRLNTTYGHLDRTEATNSLPGAHRVLAGESAALPSVVDAPDDHPWYADRRYDPLGDSARAAALYDRGEYRPVCQHNLADLHRTWELGELVRALVAPADRTTKKL